MNKLNEYKSLLDFDHEDYGKDFKNNYKFINWAVKKMFKNRTDEKEIMNFLKDTIEVHKRTY